MPNADGQSQQSDRRGKGQKHRPAKRQAGQGRRGRFGHIYAALDLGTNNCRLLVAKPTHDGFRVIDAFSRIVRLGEGIGHQDCLGQDAMDRAVAALTICARKMGHRRVTRARCVATEACRKAVNGSDFVARVEHETGLHLDIIANDEEAHLAAVGCTPLVHRDTSHALVFDIGGGSTELMWVEVDQEKLSKPWPRCGDGLNVRAWTSLPDGVVTLAERHGGLDIPCAVYEEMVDLVADKLRNFAAGFASDCRIDTGKVQMIGTSGTVTTLAGIHLKLPRYDRNRVDGLSMSIADGIAISRRLAEMSYEARAAHPCIGRQRADLVVAGCAIFEAICRTWPVQGFTVADRGLREGILMSLMRTADREWSAQNRQSK